MDKQASERKTKSHRTCSERRDHHRDKPNIAYSVHPNLGAALNPRRNFHYGSVNKLEPGRLYVIWPYPTNTKTLSNSRQTTMRPFADMQGPSSSPHMSCTANDAGYPKGLHKKPDVYGLHDTIISTRPRTPGEVAAAEGLDRLSLNSRKRAAKSDIQPLYAILDDHGLDKLNGMSRTGPKRVATESREHVGVAAEEPRFLDNPDASAKASVMLPTESSASNTLPEAQSFVKKEILEAPHDASPLVGGETKSSARSRYPGMLAQPESRPITSDQLTVEVKNIYATLVTVEASCIQVDEAELARHPKRDDVLDHEKLQTSLALHRTLLSEHHDFLSASQHPAAHDRLKRLALKYSMPARMWKHGIHSFLEVLRRRLPGTMDYMLQFIYTAYQMIALLYETVDAFRSTWIECLGDLARYRMAIEDGAQKDREIWGAVARSWYSTAYDINPQIGRLCHHLGILARPNAVQQLCYYSRALTCVEPFPNARESLSALLSSAFESRKSGRALPHVDGVDAILLYLHSIMFIRVVDNGSSDDIPETFQHACRRYISKLDNQLDSLGTTWKIHGVSIAIANVTACVGYGFEMSGTMSILAFSNCAEGPARTGSTEVKACTNAAEDMRLLDASDVQRDGKCSEQPSHPQTLLLSVFTVVLQHQSNCSVLPHVHILLVFIRSVVLAMFRRCPFLEMFLQLVPWGDLVNFLNSFATTDLMRQAATDNCSPESLVIGYKGEPTPLPEDYSLRGEVWVQGYFSEKWFCDSPDEDMRYLEQASTDKMRIRRVLSLGIFISKCVNYIDYDSNTLTFSTTQQLSTKTPAILSPKVQYATPQKCPHYGDCGQ